MDRTLYTSIAEFIEDPASGDFGSLAVSLFRRQVAANAPYRRFVTASRSRSEDVGTWLDIPAAPAAAFKAFDLTCVPLEYCRTIFHSSGTTTGTPSRHFMDVDAIGLYDLSLRRGFASGLPEASGKPLWAMMPPPGDAPHSSLSHMLGALGARKFFWADWEELADALETLSEPITLFGTGFAFVALFERFPDRSWPLPEGSLVVSTGGFKGRTREVARDVFYGWLRERLRVPDFACAAEYGMSEMSSQFYSRGETGVLTGPHWARTRVIDPETGDDAPEGTAGLLRHYDLANWNSVVAVQTQDLGIRERGGVTLVGRAPDAEVRGCSLMVEELWNRS